MDERQQNSDVKFTGRHFTRDQIKFFTDEELWAVVRSTNAMTEMFANELTWAKAELRHRGHAVQ
jgi:hypothetical protein